MTIQERRWRKELRRRKIHQGITRSGPRGTKSERLKQAGGVSMGQEVAIVQPTPASALPTPIQTSVRTKPNLIKRMFGRETA